jgi:pyruvate dehydrogenase E1 component alpha subunit
MGAHTTTDDPTRYRLKAEEESWKLKDPIERVKAYLVRNDFADAAFFEDVEAEAKKGATELRKQCLALPDPEPLDIFENVYAESHPLMTEEQQQFAAYLASFEEEVSS